jgi:urea carboxylase
MAFEGGLDVAPVLGSPATFRPGSIGGLGGRALRRGDLLRLARPGAGGGTEQRLRADVRPETPRDWTVEALPGPQGAPEYLTAEGLRRLFELHWRVSPHSNRVGIRLAPERLGWSRPSGGLAGRHPSNILDQPYPLGGVNLAGDTPVILGPDAPTAGGFVIAATVVSGAIWKLGQVRPGLDTLRLRSVGLDEADAIARELDELLTPESLEPVR